MRELVSEGCDSCTVNTDDYGEGERLLTLVFSLSLSTSPLVTYCSIPLTLYSLCHVYH